jgi:hypothetical protein
LGEITGQEAEALTGLYRRAHENNAADTVRL